MCTVHLEDIILDTKCHHTHEIKKKKKRYRITIQVGELIQDENTFLKNSMYI